MKDSPRQAAFHRAVKRELSVQHVTKALLQGASPEPVDVIDLLLNIPDSVGKRRHAGAKADPKMKVKVLKMLRSLVGYFGKEPSSWARLAGAVAGRRLTAKAFSKALFGLTSKAEDSMMGFARFVAVVAVLLFHSLQAHPRAAHDPDFHRYANGVAAVAARAIAEA